MFKNHKMVPENHSLDAFYNPEGLPLSVDMIVFADPLAWFYYCGRNHVYWSSLLENRLFY